MHAEFIALNQTIEPGAAVVFGEGRIRDSSGMIYHRADTGLFKLASPSTQYASYHRRCCCGAPKARYLTLFSGNILVPTGGTVEEIQLVLSLEGVQDPGTLMRFTPAAVEVAGNVGTSTLEEIPWICRCGDLAIINPGTQPIVLTNGTLVLDYLGISR